MPGLSPRRCTSCPTGAPSCRVLCACTGIRRCTRQEEAAWGFLVCVLRPLILPPSPHPHPQHHGKHVCCDVRHSSRCAGRHHDSAPGADAVCHWASSFFSCPAILFLPLFLRPHPPSARSYLDFCQLRFRTLCQTIAPAKTCKSRSTTGARCQSLVDNRNLARPPD